MSHEKAIISSSHRIWMLTVLLSYHVGKYSCFYAISFFSLYTSFRWKKIKGNSWYKLQMSTYITRNISIICIFFTVSTFIFEVGLIFIPENRQKVSERERKVGKVKQAFYLQGTYWSRTDNVTVTSFVCASVSQTQTYSPSLSLILSNFAKFAWLSLLLSLFLSIHFVRMLHTYKSFSNQQSKFYLFFLNTNHIAIEKTERR